MKNQFKHTAILALLAFGTLCGCAELKGKISAERKVDEQKQQAFNSDSAYKAVSKRNESLEEQLSSLNVLLEQKNLHTHIQEEDGEADLSGWLQDGGAKGNGKDKLVRSLKRGRIETTGTYDYGLDSLYINLVVGDSFFNVHRKTTDITDNSRSQQIVDINSSLKMKVEDTAGVVSEKKVASETSSNKKTDTKISGSASLAWGAVGMLPVLIAFLLGILLGRWTKRPQRRA